MTPSTALDALRNPSNALKTCLDQATAIEQAFAMGAAMASKNISDWLTELSTWAWPTEESGSTGFDPVASRGRQRRGSHGGEDAAADSKTEGETEVVGDKTWLGCLEESRVLHYEQRLATIQAELDDMDIEGIKRHVLHNHIMPLSRPGTPMSARSVTSVAGSTSSFYNKMDDITALITATVVQTLPNLSRLVRLMRSWRVRLLILRRVPTTLALLDEAEVALRSGWNVIAADISKNIGIAITTDSAVAQQPTLLQHDFDVIKAVLSQKIGPAARAIDFMLDQLDGRPETVPSEWIDRMDSLEKGYGDWIAICEKMMTEAELTKTVRRTPSSNMLDQPLEIFAERPTSSASSVADTITSNENTNTPPFPKLYPRNTHAVAAEISPPSSPPSMGRNLREGSLSFTEIPLVMEEDESMMEGTPPKSPPDSSFLEDYELETPTHMPGCRSDHGDELQRKISSILGSIPAKIHLSSQPNPANHLNPPDLHLPHLNTKSSRHFDRPSASRTQSRSQSSLSTRSSRAGTPAFLLAPAFARTTKSRMQREIQVYHLSRESTGEPPIKLFIRLVGENGDRCMVRVGGGWADLGEYLKEYAIHHGRRSKAGRTRVEVKDIANSSPGNRPASVLDSPITPLQIRKTRSSFGGMDVSASSARRHALHPQTPLSALSTDSTSQIDNEIHQMTPPSEVSTRSRSSSHLSWTEEDSFLGMSGPTGKQVVLDAERKEWVDNVKERVRIASGERRPPPTTGGSPGDSFFGEISKVGGTKRFFRKGN